jgi:hypothetical protein
MNEPMLEELRILVERAVRPVVASAARKRIMRKELFAHVIAVFEEETAKTGDKRAALDMTAQRFGNPKELTSQLQESLPWSDSYIRFLENVFVTAGASRLRLVIRYSLYSLLVGAILTTVFYAQDRMAEWPVVAASAALSFVCVVLVDALRDALFGPKGRSWRKVAVVVVASWIFIPVVTFALCLTFSGDWRSSLTDLLPLVPAALLSPAALISPAYALALDAATQREWANLRIE